ncbi:MAG: cytochrome c oxidase assembly protein [Chloroflexi bacterium]|nr:cytochrome c oxidase assembly protein [Chloroflexota bacterium]MCI0575621.1 cytochrome c oxidase assembly protein [Chloroflexota bacterium]MCI0648627.1 cytochrome c oxidase assembly protein [Chloroflexota bacterium]MCI0728158.1 cytochrome c oxidase assembly protein [Chloroflexota bacterium]
MNHHLCCQPEPVNGLTLLPLIVVAALYLYGRSRLPGRRSFPDGRDGAFGAALAVLFASLVWPLPGATAISLAAHMVQHILLVLAAAPLLVWAAPQGAFLLALPRPLGRLGGGLWQTQWLRAGWRGVARPLAGWSLHALAIWAWHTPALYQAALEQEGLHVLEHGSFLGTAGLFWAVLRGRQQSWGILYLFTAALQSGLLGALMSFSPRPWYPSYTGPGTAWDLSPLEDQQLAGAIMWIPAGVVYLIVALGLLWRWLQQLEAADRQQGYSQWLPLLALALLWLTACGDNEAAAREMTGGDPDRGRQAILAYGCPACHTIPGIPGATATVGPPLSDWAKRHYIAGSLANTPENLVRWLDNPQAIEPGTAMPDLDVSEEAARDISAYLYSLR